MARLLVIEDEEVLARSIRKTLEKLGHEVAVAPTIAQGESEFAQFEPDLTLLDLRLPDGSGLDLLQRIRQQHNSAVVIIMTAFATVEDAVTAIKLGARDYLQKPLNLDDLRHAVSRALEETQLRTEVGYYRAREARGSGIEELVGSCDAIRELRVKLERLCSLPQGASPPTVLVTGETGTGKGLLARVLHYNGPRRDRPFVEINCAAIPETLVESELFGHERGAFTDARSAKPGLFQAADRGTLFLDEIGTLPLATQVKVLKAIEEKVVRPLGARAGRSIDTQIVAATNSDLEAMVRAGTFREDLFYRLNVAHLRVPPLRDRDEDVVQLAERFLGELAARYRLPPKRLTPAARVRLQQHPWPGNIRELRNTLDRTMLFSTGEQIDVDELGLPVPVGAPGGIRATSAQAFTIEIPDAGLDFEELERALLAEALRKASGSPTRAARLLGLSRDTLRYRMEKFGLEGGGTPEG